MDDALKILELYGGTKNHEEILKILIEKKPNAFLTYAELQKHTGNSVENISSYCKHLERLCLVEMSFRYPGQEKEVKAVIHAKETPSVSHKQEDPSHFLKEFHIMDPLPQTASQEMTPENHVRQNVVFTKDLSYTQNIFYHFASKESAETDGILTQDLIKKMGLEHRKKGFLSRLDNSMKTWASQVDCKPDRKGREFNKRFLFKKNYLPEYKEPPKEKEEKLEDKSQSKKSMNLFKEETMSQLTKRLNEELGRKESLLKQQFELRSIVFEEKKPIDFSSFKQQEQISIVWALLESIRLSSGLAKDDNSKGNQNDMQNGLKSMKTGALNQKAIDLFSDLRGQMPTPARKQPNQKGKGEPEPKNRRSKNQITRRVIDRVFFMIQKLEFLEVVSLLDMKNMIRQELEPNQEQIDKRTVKSLIEHLKQLGVAFVDSFKISINSQENDIEGSDREVGILRYFRVSPRDPRIFQNPVLVNPMFRRDLPLPLTTKAKILEAEEKQKKDISQSQRKESKEENGANEETPLKPTGGSTQRKEEMRSLWSQESIPQESQMEAKTMASSTDKMTTNSSAVGLEKPKNLEISVERTFSEIGHLEEDPKSLNEERPRRKADMEGIPITEKDLKCSRVFDVLNKSLGPEKTKKIQITEGWRFLQKNAFGFSAFLESKKYSMTKSSTRAQLRKGAQASAFGEPFVGETQRETKWEEILIEMEEKTEMESKRENKIPEGSFVEIARRVEGQRYHWENGSERKMLQKRRSEELGNGFCVGLHKDLQEFVVSLDKNAGYLSQRIANQYKKKFNPSFIASLFELEGLFD